MIVLDASLVVELLRNGDMADSVRGELADLGGSVLVPHLLDVEVTSALRNLVSGRRMDAHRAAQMIEDLAGLPAVRCSHLPLLDRMWELRHNFTAYDAAYIALAEATGALLCTGDKKMSSGHRAEVRLFAL